MNEIYRSKIRYLLILDGGDRGKDEPPEWLVDYEGAEEQVSDVPRPEGSRRGRPGERLSRFGALEGIVYGFPLALMVWALIYLICSMAVKTW